MVDKNKRKRHRYVVLTPTTFAYFNDEADADITDEGFMQGEIVTSSTLPVTGNAGASIALARVYQADPALNGDSTFTLVLTEALEDGSQALELLAASVDIAKGWSDAINSQKERYKHVVAPPRTARKAEPAAVKAAGVATDIAAGAAATLMSGSDEVTKALTRGFLGLMGVNTGDDSGRTDADYHAVCPWEAKGIDLTSKSARTCWEDEHGHDATVMHGWLTKRNKSGVYAGQIEKERYFVLTPTHLCFFPSLEDADVRNGYMWGKAEGEKIVNNLFRKHGARLPLESVCEVRLLAKEGDAKHNSPGSHARRSPGSAGGGSKSSSSSHDSDDEDNDEDEKKKKKAGGGGKPSGSKPSGNKPTAPKPGEHTPGKPPKPEGPAPSTLLEIDFGEFALVVNAHNPKCRSAWSQGLRKWSGIRKRQVDEALFSNLGGF